MRVRLPGFRRDEKPPRNLRCASATGAENRWRESNTPRFKNPAARVSVAVCRDQYPAGQKMSGRADRQRLYRQRIDAGQLILKILVDELEAAAVLVRRGFLDANKQDDKHAIAAAFQQMIDDLLAAERDA